MTGTMREVGSGDVVEMALLGLPEQYQGCMCSL